MEITVEIRSTTSIVPKKRTTYVLVIAKGPYAIFEPISKQTALQFAKF